MLPHVMNPKLDGVIQDAILQLAEFLSSKVNDAVFGYKDGFERATRAWFRQQAVTVAAGGGTKLPPTGDFHYAGLMGMKTSLIVSDVTDNVVVGSGAAANQARKEIVDEITRALREYNQVTVSPPCLSLFGSPGCIPLVIIL